MKVYIGSYKAWYGPFQLTEKLLWPILKRQRTPDLCYPDWFYNLVDWLSFKKDGTNTWLNNLCEWIHSKRKRIVKVKIDDYDVWSNFSLALIIKPWLEQLKKSKMGSPKVDDEDVPEGIRSTDAKVTEDDLDEFYHQRWEYVLDEMIWAFGQVPEDGEGPDVLDVKELNEHHKRLNNGLRLFGKYFSHLWA